MLEFYNDPGEDLKQYLSPKYLKAMKMGLENGVEFIFCDADEKFRDNITVSPQTKAPANFTNAPLDGVQLMIRGIFQQNGVETKIHKLQRTTRFSGLPQSWLMRRIMYHRKWRRDVASICT